MPSKTPPKYVYEVTYHPSSRPGLDLGYPDHQHLNPFAELAGNKHEQFRYSYSLYNIGMPGNGGKNTFLPNCWLLFHLLFLHFCSGTLQRTMQRQRNKIASQQWLLTFFWIEDSLLMLFDCPKNSILPIIILKLESSLTYNMWILYAYLTILIILQNLN